VDVVYEILFIGTCFVGEEQIQHVLFKEERKKERGKERRKSHIERFSRHYGGFF